MFRSKELYLNFTSSFCLFLAFRFLLIINQELLRSSNGLIRQLAERFLVFDEHSERKTQMILIDYLRLENIQA